MVHTKPKRIQMSLRSLQMAQTPWRNSWNLPRVVTQSANSSSLVWLISFNPCDP